MKIITYVLGELQTNCYLVYDEGTKEGIVIDPADDANFISEQVLRENIKLRYLVATHGHFDHLLAAYELQLAFNIPVLLNEKDMPIVNYLTKSATYWLKRIIIEKPPQNIEYIKEGESIKFGSEGLKVTETPGHSPGGICLYSANANCLFTGDTLFADCVGRTDLPYSSKNDLENSIKKLSKLSLKTKIYPGHGESSNLEESLKSLQLKF